MSKSSITLYLSYFRQTYYTQNHSHYITTYTVINKLAVILGLVSGAFVISTIVLAVFVAQHGSALDECEKKRGENTTITSTERPVEATTVEPIKPEKPVKEVQTQEFSIL